MKDIYGDGMTESNMVIGKNGQVWDFEAWKKKRKEQGRWIDFNTSEDYKKYRKYLRQKRYRLKNKQKFREYASKCLQKKKDKIAEYDNFKEEFNKFKVDISQTISYILDIVKELKDNKDNKLLNEIINLDNSIINNYEKKSNKNE